MEVISYENIKGIATVGFKENNFVVYASVHFINGESREKLLQRAYKKAKPSIDYELTQEDHAFITDETGDEFIPDEAIVDRVEINGLSSLDFSENQEDAKIDLSATVYDQYGEELEAAVEWLASEGSLEGNQLTIEKPSKTQSIKIIAKVNDVKVEQDISVYPYVAPVYVKPIEEEIAELKDENLMNMMAMIEMFENNIALAEQNSALEAENTNTMLAIAELYEVLIGGM